MRTDTIRLEDVSKDYGITQAVRGISFSVGSGEFFTLLGPSGCGKSTILRIVAGLARPTAGRVFINGGLANDIPAYQRDTAMVFQNYAVFPHMSVEDNVAFGLRMRKVPKNETSQRVRRMLDLVRLAGLADKYPHQCSGGEQQRIALARALVLEPSVLLLDEPLSNLDIKLQEHMRFEIKALQRTLNVTTLYVTHNQEEALAMSDRIAVISEGRIEQIGGPLEVYEHPVNHFVANFVGEMNELHGVVSERAGDLISVKLEASDRVIVGRTGSSTPLSIGDAATVAIRPERIVLRTGSQESRLVEGRIADISSLGRFFRYTVEFGGNQLTVVETNVNGSPAHRHGEFVELDWKIEDSRVWPTPP